MIELGKYSKVSRLIGNRTEYCSILIAAMKNAVTINDHTGLELLFSGSPRAQAYLKHGWLDINSSLDNVNERSFLHLAARADNMELVVWGLKYGADPNCTDSKGKKPIELAKSERVKDLLRHAKSNAAIVSESLSQATNSESPQQTLLEAPTIKGMLSKYTNLKDGYQQRYFVLENGVFSYYHSMHDYPLQCRGSIATRALTAHFSGSDQSRFDVSVEGQVKFYLRARSVAEAKKWVWALMESKKWMIDHLNDQNENTLNLSETPSEFGSQGLVDGELTRKMEDAEISAQPLETEEERNDLIEYLDKHACNGFDNPELKRLLTLLKTELDAQKSTVTTVSNIMGDVAELDLKVPMLSNLSELPHLLADSSSQIEALVFGIVRFMNRRETVLEQRLLQSQSNLERLETIMNQLEVDAIKHVKESPIKPVMKVNPSSIEKDEFDTASDSGDEFFDAMDGNINAGSPTSAKSDIFYQIPQEVQALQPTDGFITTSELEQLLSAYYKLWPSRAKLPLDPTLPMPKLAVWSFLKSAIGKDLSKITLPVLFNEPLSMLQRFAEDLEYIELLTVAARIGSGDNADKLADPIMKQYCGNVGLNQQTLQSKGDDSSLLRLAYVAAFAISNYSSTVDRTSKPFNPMLVFILIRVKLLK